MAKYLVTACFNLEASDATEAELLTVLALRAGDIRSAMIEAVPILSEAPEMATAKLERIARLVERSIGGAVNVLEPKSPHPRMVDGSTKLDKRLEQAWDLAQKIDHWVHAMVNDQHLEAGQAFSAMLDANTRFKRGAIIE